MPKIGPEILACRSAINQAVGHESAGESACSNGALPFIVAKGNPEAKRHGRLGDRSLGSNPDVQH